MKTPVTNTNDPAVERNISRSDMDIVIAVLDKIPELNEVPATLDAIQVLEASVVDKAGEVAANTLIVQSETAIAVSNAASALDSKNAAGLSEINASNSANSATISKDNALASAVSANASAQSALNSKDSANLSAVSASTSEGIATQKALEASVSASTAMTSETNASLSASNANTSEVNSSLSEQNALQSETNATISETNALNSAEIALAQSNIATTKATESSISAFNALISETNAHNSEVNASTSEANTLTYKNQAESFKSTLEVNATIATNKATEASISADTATTQANIATTKSNDASISASSALVSETNASNSANIAIAQATIAVTKASEAATSADNALASDNKAEKWATELEDVEVEPGKYSAMHWAIKADNIINGISAVDDQVTNTVNTYSSNKIQSMHYVQATTIANLASASATIGSSSSQVIPEELSGFYTLVWDNITESSNSNVFELGSSSFVFKKNGIYNFFNSLDIYRIGSGATLTITFELYDADTGITIMSAILPIDMQSGTKQIIPFNVLLEIADVVATPKTIKVRMKSTSAAGSIELYTFNSILSLSSVSSTANVDTLDDALGTLITGVLI